MESTSFTLIVLAIIIIHLSIFIFGFRMLKGLKLTDEDVIFMIVAALAIPILNINTFYIIRKDYKKMQRGKNNEK